MSTTHPYRDHAYRPYLTPIAPIVTTLERTTGSDERQGNFEAWLALPVAFSVPRADFGSCGAWLARPVACSVPASDRDAVGGGCFYGCACYVRVMTKNIRDLLSAQPF